MKIKLREYQKELSRGLARSISKGNKKVIGQAPTGSGKTVIFSSIVDSFIKKSNGRVLILVHRKELRTQAVNSLKKFYNINSFEIKAGSKHLPIRDVYVGLVQTIYNRLEKLPDIDMLIVDESHLLHFQKVIDEIKGDPMIIGFSATPVTASKKRPLKDLYSDIICGPQIKTLIKEGSLSQNYTYAPRTSIDRSKFKKNNLGDFRDKDMAEEFTKQKNIKTTRIAYEKHSKGEKTIIFNVNIDHSHKVLDEFIMSGYPYVRHVDGKTKKDERKRIFEWFAKTDNAILLNVGIATMGFDEPTIKTVIVNRSTTSLPLWLQMTGRGSRVIPDIKNSFKIIDLGGNAIKLGDWNADRNWEYIFKNPDKPAEDGIPPMKDCPNCEAILHARIMECPYCEHIFERRKEEEMEIVMDDFELLTKDIIVQKEINFANSRGFKTYSSFFAIHRKIAIQLKNSLNGFELTEEIINKAMDPAHEIGRKWCKENGKRYNKWHREMTEKEIRKHLNQ